MVLEYRFYIWDYESWWHKIEKPEDLKQITDQNINKQWYVALAKIMTPNDKKKKKNT